LSGGEGKGWVAIEIIGYELILVEDVRVSDMEQGNEGGYVCVYSNKMK